ncbi:MAG: hypothetical protein HGA35_01920, partial [Erysipelotrichaceae bacterium]|nr:hypothetical protein [Erysipelotrichaceae bacterium]
MNRTNNRQKFDRVEVERELLDPQARRHHVFHRLKHLLQIRSASIAFQPQSEQRILAVSNSAFAVERTFAAEHVLCLHNVTAQSQTIQLDDEWHTATDLVTARTLTGQTAMLAPYQVVW